MTLTCRSQWITMPGHTINKLLTPPDFLQHTPVPHVEKSSHARRKKHRTTSMLWSQWLITVSESPHISNLHHNLMRNLWKYGLTFKGMMRSESWARRSTVVKLTVLAPILHYYSSLQIGTKNRCCLSIPNNRHQLLYHGNADALEKCSSPQLKHIILERLRCWFNQSLYNCFQFHL